MRVLVTGANGMLGLDLCPLLERAEHDVIRTGIGLREGIYVPRWEWLDITDTQETFRLIREYDPHVVIHGAAYTDVDGCERNPDLAYKVNGLGTWNLASVCGANNITLIYVSTDFVFDGTKTEPYTEFDVTHPISHYGASKYAGEQFVRQLCRKHFIVRTAWLFGVHGKSFPSAILTAAQARADLSVVCDEVGSPTHTVDLAQTLVSLLESPLYGTYHVTNSGHCSRFEFAQKILELSGITHVELKPMPASQWPSPTKRPAYSVMRRFALELQGKDNLRPWQEALTEFIALRKAVSVHAR